MNESKKGKEFLCKDILHTSEYRTIEEDLLEIIHKYYLRKNHTVELIDTGTLLISIQDDFPSSLIGDLDEYMGLTSKVKHGTYSTNIIYCLSVKLE